MDAVSDIATRGLHQRLSSPELRRLIEKLVRRRVPHSDVEDVVQTILCDALAAERPPDDDEHLRKWIVGITRHKVADFHRHGARVRHVELPVEVAGDSPPHSAKEWAEWAERQTEGDADAERTLDWMAREGGGEKLAQIAASERMPATQVRQRVSRMRRFMKQRWAIELAAVAGVGLAVVVAWMALRDRAPVAEPVEPRPVPEHMPAPWPDDPKLAWAHQLRADALRDCDRNAWERCVAGLDEAARIDPRGDDEAAVVGARRAAREGLAREQQRRDDELAPPTNKTPPPVPTDNAPSPWVPEDRPKKPQPVPQQQQHKKKAFYKGDSGEPVEPVEPLPQQVNSPPELEQEAVPAPPPQTAPAPRQASSADRDGT